MMIVIVGMKPLSDQIMIEQIIIFHIKKAEIHHCEGSTVGMGRNRKTMVHLGLELMPLCREHHGECHNIGQKAFNEKYHLQGIPADEKICKKAGLKYAD